MVCLSHYSSEMPLSSAVGCETWSLIWEWSSLTAIITGAPSSSLAESGSSALPGLRALLGTLPVIGFRNVAVLVGGSGGSVLGPVSLPELGSVVEILSSGGDDGVSESNGRRGSGELGELGVVVVVVSGGDDSEESGKDLHYNT